MLKKLLATVALIGALVAPAHADQRFLNAASYFLSGFDADNGVKYTVLKDGSEAAIWSTHGGGITIFQDEHNPCTVHYINFFALGLEVANGKRNFPLTATTVDFTKMPSPRDINMRYSIYPPAGSMIESAVKDAGNGSVSFVPTGKTFKSFYFGSFGNLSRRLNALDFIRANYCQGLPDVRGY